MSTGCYELKAINGEIIFICGNSDITILLNVNTLQWTLTLVVTKCKVSFDVPNFLASVLGFKQSIVYGVGRHTSENLVNIMCVNFILVHCNIHSSYMRGTQAPVAYNFFPNAAPGQKIIEVPNNLIYLPVLSVLCNHLPIQLATRYREKMCCVNYHVSEDRLSIVESSGGVQTIRNVSAYHEPAHGILMLNLS